MDKPILISFYTNDWKYTEYANKLKEQCEKQGIDYHIQELKSTGSYLKNTCLKPQFILDCLKRFKRPVVWVDVDSTVTSKLKMITLKCDIAAEPFPEHRTLTYYVSVIYFNYNKKVLEFVRNWISKTGQYEDHHGFEEAYEISDINIIPLPDAYQAVFKHGTSDWANKHIERQKHDGKRRNFDMTINVLCMKWKRDNVPLEVSGFKTARVITEYTAQHVNNLYSMLKRNLRAPFKLFCATDDTMGIREEVHILPMWKKHQELGGCYRKLYTFSDDMKWLVGDKFVYIDLDVVIVSDITKMFLIKDDFWIYEDSPNTDQLYNSSLFGLKAGSKVKVWNSFDKDPQAALEALRQARAIKKASGSDQAWIRLVIGAHEKIERYGIYHRGKIGNRPLPRDAKIVFFYGSYDPSLDDSDWVKEHWR